MTKNNRKLITGSNLTKFISVATTEIDKKKKEACHSNLNSLASPIYGSVVFNLTFFNEVTRSNETLYRLHANVIDSCIDIIPVIREHYLLLSHRSLWESYSTKSDPRLRPPAELEEGRDIHCLPQHQVFGSQIRSQGQGCGTQ